MKRVARIQDNPNFVRMYHGNLEILVPRKIFVYGTADLIDIETEKFLNMLSARYPWLSSYALEEIKKGAVEAMKDHLERSKTASQRAREYMAAGKYAEALSILESHLIEDENDAESWYAASEALFKLGRQDEGFRAMNHARFLSRKDR